MKSEEYKFKKFKGITLISLVITIVILIILASVAIYLSLGDNGLFNRAKQAKEVTNKQEATDIINLKITTAQMNKYAEKQEMPTLKELSEVLRYDDEIQYVTEKSQVASKKYEVGENPSSIYTKLNKYPYEFEINSRLQLASINGIKIADNNIEGSNILFEGKMTLGAEVELTDKLSNYKYIKVYFNNIEEKEACPSLEFDINSILKWKKFDIYHRSGGWSYAARFVYNNENNKIKNTDNTFFGGDPYGLNSSLFCLEIYKIVGIK